MASGAKRLCGLWIMDNASNLVVDEFLGVVIRCLIQHGVANCRHEARPTPLPRGLKERVRFGFCHFIKQGRGFYRGFRLNVQIAKPAAVANPVIVAVSRVISFKGGNPGVI